MHVIKKIVITCDEWMEVCWVVHFLARFNSRYVKENSSTDARSMDKICLELGTFAANFGHACPHVIFFFGIAWVQPMVRETTCKQKAIWTDVLV